MDTEVRLKGNFVDSQIHKLMENGDRMDRKTRIRITRLYVRYVLVEYIKKFESPHPVADVISYVAGKLSHLFPTMRDLDTPIDSPTYVSIIFL